MPYPAFRAPFALIGEGAAREILIVQRSIQTAAHLK
jgi:hypothetical protein